MVTIAVIVGSPFSDLIVRVEEEVKEAIEKVRVPRMP